MDQPTRSVPEEHFVETHAGVCDAVHFRLNEIGDDFVLAGLEDGSLHLYNLTKNFGKSHQTPQASLRDPFSHFVESNFEHQDAIVSVDKASNNSILTASRDGAIMLWTVGANQMEGDDMLRFVADQHIRNEPLTRVKFINESQILASTIQGNLFLSEICKDSQNVPFLDKPKLFFHTDSAIWDFGVFRLSPDSPQQIVIAQDSGRVT